MSHIVAVITYSPKNIILKAILLRDILISLFTSLATLLLILTSQ